MTNKLRLAELLCTRLCHDLTGPIGAVANGAEFLAEENSDMQTQALDLIGTSAAQAVARLQFFRKAYGRINDNGEAELADYKKTTQNFFIGSKIIVDWPEGHTDASGVSVSGKMGRVLLNLIIIVSASLLRGGTISIRIAEENLHKVLYVSGTGTSIKWDNEIEEALSGKIEIAYLLPKTVQPYLTYRLAQELQASISWEQKEALIECVVRQPVETVVL